MTTKTAVKLLKDSLAFAKERAKDKRTDGIQDFWLGKVQGLEFAIQLLTGKEATCPAIRR